MIEKGFNNLEQKNKPRLYRQIADKILLKHTLICCQKDFYEYKAGVFRDVEEYIVRQYIDQYLKNKGNNNAYNEVFHHLRMLCGKPHNALNPCNLINLKNGMLDIDNLDIHNLVLIPHDPKYLSTIQLNINLKEDATEANPKLWLSFLKDIFYDDNAGYKMRTLQEYMGLCLTKEVKYEKCLWMLGKGANGKGVIDYTLRQLVGEENSSSISVEFLAEDHYQAELFGKLVNISSEPKSKNKVCDELFKKVISGDSLQAAAKYKKSIKFSPFCKMVISANSHPRVDDRSDGYWRRLLILRFNKQYGEEEQDRELRAKLFKELDDIFIWSLFGLQRLKRRGYFEVSSEMKEHIEKIKDENNNVRIFIDECCTIDGFSDILIKVLYRNYKDWTKESGGHAFGKVNFGEELLKIGKGKINSRKSGDHYWKGIRYDV